MTVSEESSCCRVPVNEVSAALMRLVYGVDLVRVCRQGLYRPHVSHFSPSLRRPVIWPSTVQ